jgi:hypothetical protein
VVAKGVSDSWKKFRFAPRAGDRYKVMAIRPTRRQFLAGCVGTGLAVATGCGTTAQVGRSALPGVAWPSLGTPPIPDGQPYDPNIRVARVTPGKLIPRSHWAKAGPITSRVNPMGRVNSITVHHEGAAGSPVTFTDVSSTAARLEIIRQAHLERMAAGDIGYHFVIDRAGRIWEGRSLAYQGAHVKYHNEHNIGVMVLGNFEIQKPAGPQLTTLRSLVRSLRNKFGVDTGAIYTHRELGPTSCPGSALQPKVDLMRRRNAFA